MPFTNITVGAFIVRFFPDITLSCILFQIIVFLEYKVHRRDFMFCSNCGKEAIGKFCTNCGVPIKNESNTEPEINFQGQPANSEPQIADYYMVVNNIQLNLSEIVRLYGNNKIDAIKFVKAKTGTSLKDAKSVIDNAYAYEQMNQEPKKGFWEKIKEDNEKQQILAYDIKKENIQRLEQLEKERVAYCPKCYSTSLSANKKRFSLGKALFGEALIGKWGLLAGSANSDKIEVTCLKCGHKFWPGGK